MSSVALGKLKAAHRQEVRGYCACVRAAKPVPPGATAKCYPKPGRLPSHHSPIPARPADFSEAGDNTGFAGFSGLTGVKVGNARAKTLPRC
jgi:hypothetical protein